MPNESTPSPDILAGSPKGEDVAAVSGGILAAEHNRSFVTGHDSLQLDTQRLLEIVTRLEAASREPPRHLAATLSSGLRELAAIIERIESTLLASEGPAPDVHFALAHIHNVATALRERDVAPAACATLEAAIREVADAIARGDAAAERAVSAAVSLRYLAGRVDELSAVAASIAASAAEPPEGAARLPTFQQEIVERSDHVADMPMADSADASSADDACASQPRSMSMPPTLPDKEAALNEVALEEAAPEKATLGPREDPADLFEPGALPMSAPPDAREEVTQVGGSDNNVADEDAADEAATVHSRARDATASEPALPKLAAGTSAAANDPLAILFALSEEELIALFS